jgi:hypothetical protein
VLAFFRLLLFPAIISNPIPEYIMKKKIAANKCPDSIILKSPFYDKTIVTFVSDNLSLFSKNRNKIVKSEETFEKLNHDYAP